MAAQIKRMPLGAVVERGGVHFRVWAPERKKVAVVLEKSDQEPEAEQEAYPLKPDKKGYFAGLVPQAKNGLYNPFDLAESRNFFRTRPPASSRKECTVLRK